MLIPTLLFAATAALAAPTSPAASSVAPRAPEETLRMQLNEIRGQHIKETREAFVGSDANLRDAVSSSRGQTKKLMADRLPGMSGDPFNVCRDLAHCADAPLSFHVEDDALIDDAFMALARPWFNLQKARGKTVSVKVDGGLGVQLTLAGLPDRPTVTLESAPAPTGGFDISVREGQEAGAVYARERAAVLKPKS